MHNHTRQPHGAQTQAAERLNRLHARSAGRTRRLFWVLTNVNRCHSWRSLPLWALVNKVMIDIKTPTCIYRYLKRWCKFPSIAYSPDYGMTERFDAETIANHLKKKKKKNWIIKMERERGMEEQRQHSEKKKKKWCFLNGCFFLNDQLVISDIWDGGEQSTQATFGE